MAQSTRNKFYSERKLYFNSERGRLFVGKGRRNVLSIIEKTGVKEIDVPVGKGIITIRGAEKVDSLSFRGYLTPLNVAIIRRELRKPLCDALPDWLRWS